MMRLPCFASPTPGVALTPRGLLRPACGARPARAARPRVPAACAAGPDGGGSAGADAEAATVPAGPANPAPTAAGVSTAGMGTEDAALLEASYVADVAKIEKALDDGGSVLARDLNRRSALHFCAGNGLVTVVQRLAKEGAELDAQDMLGLTPLHMATGYKKAGTVGALVELGADANIACYGGELPVELAERLLEVTPEKKFLLPNKEYETLKEIATVLDDATETEDDDDVEDGDDVEEEGEEDEAPAAELPAPVESEAGGAKFVVRVKNKKPDEEAVSEETLPASGSAESEPVTPAADVKVTVRKRGEGAAAAARSVVPPAADVETVIRRPGETKG